MQKKNPVWNKHSLLGGLNWSSEIDDTDVSGDTVQVAYAYLMARHTYPIASSELLL